MDFPARFAELIRKGRRIHQGQALTYRNAGQGITARVPGVGDVQAICGNDINSTNISLIQDDGGRWWAFSATASRTAGAPRIRNFFRAPEEFAIERASAYFAYLYMIRSGDNVQYWVGGFQAEPVLVATIPIFSEEQTISESYSYSAVGRFIRRNSKPVFTTSQAFLISQGGLSLSLQMTGISAAIGICDFLDLAIRTPNPGAFASLGNLSDSANSARLVTIGFENALYTASVVAASPQDSTEPDSESVSFTLANGIMAGSIPGYSFSVPRLTTVQGWNDSVGQKASGSQDYFSNLRLIDHHNVYDRYSPSIYYIHEYFSSNLGTTTSGSASINIVFREIYSQQSWITCDRNNIYVGIKYNLRVEGFENVLYYSISKSNGAVSQLESPPPGDWMSFFHNNESYRWVRLNATNKATFGLSDQDDFFYDRSYSKVGENQFLAVKSSAFLFFNPYIWSQANDVINSYMNSFGTNAVSIPVELRSYNPSAENPIIKELEVPAFSHSLNTSSFEDYFEIGYTIFTP